MQILWRKVPSKFVLTGSNWTSATILAEFQLMNFNFHARFYSGTWDSICSLWKESWQFSSALQFWMYILISTFLLAPPVFSFSLIRLWMCVFLQLWCSRPSFRGEAAFLFIGPAHRVPPRRGEGHRHREWPHPASARAGHEESASHLPQFSERYVGLLPLPWSYSVSLGIVFIYVSVYLDLYS